jgi:hypothetical protein
LTTILKQIDSMKLYLTTRPKRERSRAPNLKHHRHERASRILVVIVTR